MEPYERYVAEKGVLSGDQVFLHHPPHQVETSVV